MGRLTDVDWERSAAESASYFTLSTDPSLITSSPPETAAQYASYSARRSVETAGHTARRSRRSAHSAARAAAHSEKSIFLSGANSDARDTRLCLSFDVELLTSSSNGPQALYDLPVWGITDEHCAIQTNHDTFLKILNADPKWAFWCYWYLAMWQGRFDNWNLAFEVIKIDDQIWEAGAEAVATEIERIKAEHFTTQHPLAEAIQLNPETNRFFATLIPIQNAPLIGALLSRVQDSVEDATLGKNGLNEQSREVRVLHRTLSRYSNDPQRVEMDFTSVAVGLRRQIHDTAELPNSEDNLALLEAVEDGVRGIRAAHSDVAENRLILAQQSLRELSADQVELLEDAKPVLVAISEDIMAEDFAADIPSLINDALLPLPSGAPALPGADAATRVFNRVSHIRLMYDRFVQGGAKAFDSKTFKTARLGLTAISMLSALVSLGLVLFGVM